MENFGELSIYTEENQKSLRIKLWQIHYQSPNSPRFLPAKFFTIQYWETLTKGKFLTLSKNNKCLYFNLLNKHCIE